MADQNQDLVAIYQTLCAQQDALSIAIQNATDVATATTISNEIQEVSHRIILTQNLLFKADSAKLTAMVGGIQTASQNLTKAIGQIGNVSAFLNSISGYLADVDQAIDLAKTLATAV